MYVHILMLVQLSCISTFAPILGLPPLFRLLLRVPAQVFVAGCLQTVEGALPLRALQVLTVQSALPPQLDTAIHAAESSLRGAGVHASRHRQHHGAHNHNNVDELRSLLQLTDVTSCHKHDALALRRWMIPQGHARLVFGDRKQVAHSVAVDAGTNVGQLLFG